MRNINPALKTASTGKLEDWFATQLLEWYHINKRHLPWRDSKDPFKVWLSEIILQQTRVNQGMPYYQTFVSNFTTIDEFARADLDQILKLWQGLGYYSRARNMHECAREIMASHGGNFPDNYKSLMKLKGIGKYTAAAIASICFDQDVPAIDGNVYRVMSRVFGISEDISRSGTFRVFFERAQKLIPVKSPGDYNQAVMEYGATVCTPKSPDCPNCIFLKSCHAYRSDSVSLLPIKSKKVKIKHRYFNYHVFTFGHNLLLKQRSSGDIWTGLFEFDLEEDKISSKYSNFAHAKLQYTSAVIEHQLTHQKLHIKFYVYEMPSEIKFNEHIGKNGMVAVSFNNLKNYAVPKPIEMFLNEMFCN